MEIGSLRVLQEAGKSVRLNVAIAGFNDISTARHTTPPLTTISQPIQSLGREMARMLLAVLVGDAPTPLLVPTRLVQRASSS